MACFFHQLQTQPFNCADKSYTQAEVWFHFSPWQKCFGFRVCSQWPQLHIPAPLPELPDGCRTWSHLGAAPHNTDCLTRLYPSLNTPSFSHHSQTHFHPWLEFDLNRTTSKHFTDPQVACLSPTLGPSFAGTSPTPLPWTRAELIRIPPEHIIWAISHKTDWQEIPMTPQCNIVHIMKMEKPRGLLMGELRKKKGKTVMGQRDFVWKVSIWWIYFPACGNINGDKASSCFLLPWPGTQSCKQPVRILTPLPSVRPYIMKRTYGRVVESP